MQPGDSGGGGGGGGAQATWRTDSDDLVSLFSGYVDLLLSIGDDARTMPSADGGGGFGRGGTPAMVSEDPISCFNGLEFFEGVELADHQPEIHGLDSQVDAFLDEDCGDDGFDSESDHYNELLVRCEGDTDVEDLYPTQAEVVVEDVMSKVIPGRGRASGSGDYRNSRGYSYFTARLEAQEREKAMQDGEK